MICSPAVQYFGLNTQNIGKFVLPHKSLILGKHPAARIVDHEFFREHELKKIPLEFNLVRVETSQRCGGYKS